ncbi:unnamed protein product [Durusdinium trenchii]|uniref:Potassium channel domain-containing protein n=2 Tax=Durusdinium trenchii TaxID=1381693 RepID=A0ABP0RYF3_9DINO
MFWRILIACAVILWVFAGTIFYYLIQNESTVQLCAVCPSKTETGWTFGQSFYYSVQTGLSIGFGLLSESKDWSRAYSIFHILMGSSVIAGCLSWFASATLERHSCHCDHSERELARFAHACHVDGYDGFSWVNLRDLMVKYPQFAEDFVYKLDKDHQKVTEFHEKFEKAGFYEKQNMAIKLIQRAHNELGCFKDKNGQISIDDIVKVHEESSSLVKIAQMKVAENLSAILTWAAWFIWIGLGAIVASTSCGWSWIRGIYFAVAACSTAGLEAICYAGEEYVVLSGLYCLFGVPIFGLALGRIAGVLVDKHMARKNHQKLHERITSSEMQFAKHILGHSPDSKIDASEFLQIQLLRTGAVDKETLEQIKDNFTQLADGKDYITRDMCMKGYEHRIHKHRPQNIETSI